MANRHCLLCGQRSALIALSALAAVGNFFAATQLATAWSFIRWENESEWDGLEQWTVNSMKILVGLLCIYFTVGCVCCCVGLMAVIKRKPAQLRFYRTFSMADLTFSAFSTVLLCLASFKSSFRAAICEEIAGQPDLLRDWAEAGLSLENCESWFERAVMAFVGVMAVLLVVRLQFTLTLSNYYTRVRRCQLDRTLDESLDPSQQRIYLLPARSSSPSEILVYAPVPRSVMSLEAARNLDATEAWISRSQPVPDIDAPSPLSSGPIRLPVQPGEGLLPNSEPKQAL